MEVQVSIAEISDGRPLTSEKDIVSKHGSTIADTDRQLSTR